MFVSFGVGGGLERRFERAAATVTAAAVVRCDITHVAQDTHEYGHTLVNTPSCLLHKTQQFAAAPLHPPLLFLMRQAA
jgi:hypothetical protein